MVSSSSGVKNIPVNPIAITHALNLFGPDLPNVREKTVRGKPDRVDTGFVNIPDDYHRLNQLVTLTVDIMFIL